MATFQTYCFMLHKSATADIPDLKRTEVYELASRLLGSRTYADYKAIPDASLAIDVGDYALFDMERFTGVVSKRRFSDSELMIFLRHAMSVWSSIPGAPMVVLNWDSLEDVLQDLVEDYVGRWANHREREVAFADFSDPVINVGQPSAPLAKASDHWDIPIAGHITVAYHARRGHIAEHPISGYVRFRKLGAVRIELDDLNIDIGEGQ